MCMCAWKKVTTEIVNEQNDLIHYYLIHAAITSSANFLIE